MELDGLAKNMFLHARSVERNAVNAVKDVATAVGPPVVYGTPVDTSRARANWQGSVGQPATGVLFPFPQTPPTEHSGGIIGLRSIDEAARNYRGHQNGIYIVNNLVYIGALNDGHSTQAPANFVQSAVLTAVRKVRSVRLISTFR
jgi:hypothetical protein